MLVEKHPFSLAKYRFGISGRELPVTIGYETYGKLNSAKDNAILLCHYFTGQSHAAGKYTAEDPVPGWWDAIVGPGKAIDTDKYYVICSDVIGNINANNPRVITTGPATKNPQTGREYACDFPIFTIDDMVRVQHELVKSLGIKRLAAVIGPSMGGLQAFMWNKLYPDMVGSVVAMGATPMIRPWGIMVPNQLGIDIIRLDPNWRGGNYYGHTPPNAGLLNAFKILLVATRTDAWADKLCGRKVADPTGEKIPLPATSFDGRYQIELEVEGTVLQRMQFFDANSYMYIAKANALYDLAEPGEDQETAWRRLNARTLMIIDDSDLMFTRAQAELMKKHMPKAETFYYDSGNGHLSVIFDTHHFADRLSAFLRG